METYQTYKDCGIEWVGEIPKHWDLKKLKFLVSLNDEALSEKTDDEKLIRYIEIGDLKNSVIGSSEYKFKDAPSRARRIVRSGDVIVSTVRTYLKAIAQVTSNEDGYIASTGFAVLRPINIDSGFLGYYSLSPFFIDSTIANSVGVTYPAINASNILEFLIQIPKPQEQNEIAKYLDRKTTEIDQLIIDKKHLVQLYKEEKTAIINQAVTKGINPDAPIKDSGIEWLGEVPEHWGSKRLKYDASKIGDGIHATPKYVTNSQYKFINGNNLSNGLIKFHETTRSVSEDEYFKHKRNLEKGTILISINGTIGNLALYNGEQVILGKSAAYIELNENISNQFIYFLLQSHYIKTQINLSFSGSTINNLSLYTLNNLRISLPLDINEQTQIVHYIKREKAKIEGKISKAEKYIALLTEYRTALISEVVTGKVKVV